MLVEPQKARNIKVHTIHDATGLSSFETAVQDWLEAQGEATVLGIWIDFHGANDHHCVILYTE